MAVGEMDELNSTLGICKELLIKENSTLILKFEEIQKWLFNIGAIVACPGDERSSLLKFDRSNIDGFTTQLEKWIDCMEVELESLKAFILPVNLL